MKLFFDKKSCDILGLEFEVAPEKFSLELELFVESSTETKAFLQVVDNDDQSALFSVYPKLCRELEIDCFTMPKHGARMACKLCL